jgi:hypothetical protein
MHLHVSQAHDGKLLLNCFVCKAAGRPKNEIINALREQGLWRSVRAGSIEAVPGSNADVCDEESDPVAQAKYEKFRRAFKFLYAGMRANAGAPSKYLKQRGIHLVPPNAMLLRAEVHERLTRRRCPAMVLPITNRNGTIQGSVTTSLTNRADAKLGIEKPRRTRGQLAGGYVQLGENEPTGPLVIGEGVESALSLSQIVGQPAIATLGASNLENVRPPRASEYIIAADNDEKGTGLVAAKRAAENLTNQGYVVRIALPERPHGCVKYDWNDALLDAHSDRAVERLRRAVLNAPEFALPAGRALTTRTVNRFERKEIDWMWCPFIPLGMITVLFGDGEVGKSSITLDIAARITQGTAWPRFGDDPKELAPRGSVLILCKEDDIARVVRPRLEAAGADLKRVHIVGYEDADTGDFDPVERLDEIAKELEDKISEIGDVKLIIIDPITDYVGKVDPYRDDQVRTLLNPLVRIAARHNLAITYILHLNKNKDLAARQRGIGSVAFVNVPRSALLVAEQDGIRYMRMDKANLWSRKRAVAFTMSTVRGAPRIRWEPDWHDIDANELLSDRGPNKQHQAATLLREWLEEGPSPANDIQVRAQENGISRRTLDLAKKLADVVSTKRKDGKWEWSLKAKDAKVA